LRGVAVVILKQLMSPPRTLRRGFRSPYSVWPGTAGQSVHPAEGGPSEGAYPPGERRGKGFEAARSGALARSGAGGGGRRHPAAVWRSVGEGEDEVELRSGRVAGGVEQHGAFSAGESAGAADDGEGGVGAVVEEGPFDGEVPAG